MPLGTFSKAQRSWIAAIGLGVLVFLLYMHTVGFGFFLWDDENLIVKNGFIHGLSLENLKSIFTSYDPELYLPLTFLTFLTEYQLVGAEPWLYHLTNVLLHAANSILVLLFLRKLGLTHSIALLCGIIFGLHPLNAEVATWISARKDLLSTFFMLLTLLYYLTDTRRNTARFWVISVILFTLALLSKVTAVSVPVIMLLIDWKEERGFGASHLLSKIPFFVIAGIFVVIAILGKTQNISSLTLFQTILMMSKSIIVSLRLTLFPFSLASIYHQPRATIKAAEATLMLSFIACIAGAAILYRIRRHARELVFGLGFFLVTLAPSIANFTRMGEYFVASDRYLYVPLIGILFVVGWFLSLLFDRLKRPSHVYTLTAVCLLILVASGWYARERTWLWNNSEAFFRDSSAKNPRSATMHFHLALAMHKEGRRMEAIEEYQKAIELGPRYDRAYMNLGIAFLEVGNVSAATPALKKAIELNPALKQEIEALLSQ